MRISDWSSDVCSSDLEIDLDGAVETTQSYIRNTPILVTRHADEAGNAIEVIDFCPRFKRNGRMYRPVAFVRIVRPAAGSPRVRIRLRPARNWGARQIGRASCRDRGGQCG